MIKQVVFLKRRADMTMQEFMDYYENQHSQLSKRIGAKPPLPNAQRYVRRYITPEKNPLTGEVIHPGYDCIMEIWWNTREDFEAAMKGLGNPEFLQARLRAGRSIQPRRDAPVLPGGTRCWAARPFHRDHWCSSVGLRATGIRYVLRKLTGSTWTGSTPVST